MRYLYIICLVLSSFFIYNQSSAENMTRQYAFFVPNNAYQNNTQINNIDDIRPRYTRSTQKVTSPSKETTAKAQTNTTKSQIKLPYTKQKIVEAPEEPMQPTNNTPQVKKIANQPKTLQIQAPEIISPLVQEEPKQLKTPEKAAKYNIDDDFLTSLTQPTITQTIEPEEKSISAMLSEIPFPDFEQPKFKQAFGNYGITLRAFYRQKEMPTDYEQDEVLAKANSIKRFLVK